MKQDSVVLTRFSVFLCCYDVLFVNLRLHEPVEIVKI